MRHILLPAAIWVLTRLVPEDEREPLLGDLVEEHARRAAGASSSAALRWCLRQVCASIPPLLWVRLARAAWIPTLAVALPAYIAVGIAELCVNWAISSWYGPGAATTNPLGLLLMFPTVVLIGYLAAALRPAAAMVLALMMLAAATAMALWSTESVPVWHRIAYFFVGPAAAVTGVALHLLRTERA
jgi:hypothetical protein